MNRSDKMFKRTIAILMTVISALLMLVSCGNANKSEIYWNDFILDDSGDLAEIITTEYSLEELSLFFDGHLQNENWNDDSVSLKISEVHKHFPVEVLRTGHYTVYKVKDGGYFYVFWNQLAEVLVDAENDVISESLEPEVYFVAYISSPLKESDFDSLFIDESTADDVAKIDPNFEFNRLLSRGRFSSSILENGKVLEIKYDIVSPYESRNDAIVVDIQIVELKDSTSSFVRVLEKDMPW